MGIYTNRKLTMMPLDSYFTAKPKKAATVTPLMMARWKRFQRMPHSEQARAVDVLIRKQSEGTATPAEAFIVRQWELKRSPWIV